MKIICSSWRWYRVAQASVVVAHRLSCWEACGILPDQGWTSVPWFCFFFSPSLQFIGRDRSNPGGKGCRWLAEENVNRCRSIERKQKAWIARWSADSAVMCRKLEKLCKVRQSQTEKHQYYVMLLIWNIWKRQTLSDRKKRGPQGWGRWGIRELFKGGDRVSVYADENCLELMVKVVQQCECA